MPKIFGFGSENPPKKPVEPLNLERTFDEVSKEAGQQDLDQSNDELKKFLDEMPPTPGVEVTQTQITPPAGEAKRVERSMPLNLTDTEDLTPAPQAEATDPSVIVASNETSPEYAAETARRRAVGEDSLARMRESAAQRAAAAPVEGAPADEAPEGEMHAPTPAELIEELKRKHGSPEPSADMTKAEAVSTLQKTVEGAYEGEPNYPVPAVVPEQPAAKLRRLAIETRGKDAVIQMETELGARPRTSAEFLDKSLPQAEHMYQAEQAYLEALKKYHQERSFSSIAAEQFVGNALPENVATLRAQWVGARSEYAKFLNTSADERLEAKGIDAEKKQEVLKRYQRRVLTREVVIGAEEAELRARMQGLSERERGAVEKAFETYKKLPPGVRIIATSALLTGGAALATGGATVTATALALGGAGAAMRWIAEKNNNALLASISSIGALGGALAEFGVRKVHEALGTEEKAQETLEKREDLGNLENVEELTKLSKERSAALTTGETIARQGRWARIIGAVTGGAALGATEGVIRDMQPETGAAGLPGNSNTTPETVPAPAAPAPAPAEVPPAAPPASVPPAEAPAPPPAPAEAPAVTPSAPAPVEAPAAQPAPAPEAPAAPAPSEAAAPAPEAKEAPAAPAQETAPAAAPAPAAPIDDTSLIMKWQAEHGSLPANADQNITDVIERLKQDGGPDTFAGVTYGEAPAAEVPAAPPAEAPAPAPEAPAAPAAPPVETAPVPPAEVPPPAPPAQPEAPAQPAETAPAIETPHTIVPGPETPPAFVNENGVTIDLAKPQIYAWKPEGTAEPYPVIAGGTQEEMKASIQEFLAKNPNITYVLAPTEDPATGRYVLQQYQPGATPVPGLTVFDPRTGLELPMPNPKDFVPLPKTIATLQ